MMITVPSVFPVLLHEPCVSHRVFLRVSTAVIKQHDPEQLREEKDYFILRLSDHMPSLRDVTTGTQGRNGS